MEPHRPLARNGQGGMAPGPDGPRRATRRRAADATLDRDWLEREALRHLARYESTRRSLAEVLARRIQRRCERTGEDAEGALGAIDDVVAALAEQGYVDDRRFASGLARRLREQGRSRAEIRARLRGKGVSEQAIDELEEAREDSEGELRAAWRLARRRRLGPCCPDPEARGRLRERHLGVLARRGFPLEIALRVVDAESAPEIDP